MVETILIIFTTTVFNRFLQTDINPYLCTCTDFVVHMNRHTTKTLSALHDIVRFICTLSIIISNLFVQSSDEAQVENRILIVAVKKNI